MWGHVTEEPKYHHEHESCCMTGALSADLNTIFPVRIPDTHD